MDVSNSSDAVYFGNALSISTTTPFLSTRTYYLEADSGMCMFVSVFMCVCVCVVVCKAVCVRACVCVVCACHSIPVQ